MQVSLQGKDKTCLCSLMLENITSKIKISTNHTPQPLEQISLPKASPNAEILHLSNVSLHSSHQPKGFQWTEKQMKHGNLSQTDQNQTKRESDTLVSEELLFLL